MWHCWHVRGFYYRQEHMVPVDSHPFILCLSFLFAQTNPQKLSHVFSVTTKPPLVATDIAIHEKNKEEEGCMLPLISRLFFTVFFSMSSNRCPLDQCTLRHLINLTLRHLIKTKITDLEDKSKTAKGI